MQATDFFTANPASGRSLAPPRGVKPPPIPQPKPAMGATLTPKKRKPRKIDLTGGF